MRILPAVPFSTGTAVTYYAEDMLGTSRVVTDGSGVVCYDADFYPYGGERPYINTCSPAYKFEGKERDTETGNDNFGARSYSNRFGRWLSSDWSAVPVAIPYANLTNPQTLNLYSMVADDPESFADLDGHCHVGGHSDPACPWFSGNDDQHLAAQQAQNTTDWSLSWQVHASANFLVGELQGVADVTVAPIVSAVEHPVATVEGLANAVEHPVDTAKSVVNGAVDTVKAAANGDPRAFGQVVGTVATVAYAAKNVEIGTYKNTGGGGINLVDTPTTNSRIGLDYHAFKGSNGPQLHVDITIKKPAAPFGPGASGPGSNLINIKHWTPW